jgi:hypothetical protein
VFQPAEVSKGCSDLQKNHAGFRRIRNQAIAQDDIAFAQHSGFAIVNDRGNILKIGAELAIPRPTKNDLNKLKMLILAIQKHMNRLAMAIWKR